MLQSSNCPSGQENWEGGTGGERGLKTRETNLIYMWAVPWTGEMWLGGCDREKLTLSSSVCPVHLSHPFT